MTESISTHEDGCPLAAVDRRLQDAHRLWHQAEESYFDPDGFRIAAQNTVQTLRTVTFILQKHKRLVPDFDTWYGVKEQSGYWQKRLAADPLMCWMKDARNRIEKQGDLEVNSFVRAEVLASYLEEGPRVEIPAHLFRNPAALMLSIPEDVLRKHVMKHGTLRVQRRWIENSLPDYELLDALAIAYGRITEIVHDAHRQMGIPLPRTVHDDTGEAFDIAVMDWRMPCMIGHEEPRSLLISLADGSTLEFKREAVKVDLAEAKKAAERYPMNPAEVMGRDYESEEAIAAAYFEMARTVFLMDGYHLPFLFLFRNRKLVRMFPAPAENQQQKYLLMRNLANEAVRNGADATIMVGEIWLAPQSHLAPYQRPAELATRKEALELTLVTKAGEPVQFIAMINRNGDSVSLGETSVVRGGAAFSFAPFYQAWGRPIPEAWLALGRSALKSE